MCLCQEKVIQTDDVKSLDDRPDRKKAREEPEKGETVLLPVHTADDKQTDLTREEHDQDDPSEDAFRRHRKVFDPRAKAFLYIFRKVFHQQPGGQRYRNAPDAEKKENTSRKGQNECQQHFFFPHTEIKRPVIIQPP